MRQASGNLIRGAGQDSCSGVLSLLVESPVCTCGHGRWCSGRRNEGDGSERTQGERPRASERSGKGLVGNNCKLYLTGVVRFSPEGGCFARNHFKRSVFGALYCL